MFDVFDDNLDDEDDQEFLNGAKILEASFDAGSSKRSLPNSNDEIEIELSNKRLRIVDKEKQPTTPIIKVEVAKIPNENQLLKSNCKNMMRKFAGPAGLLPNLAFDKIKMSSESYSVSQCLINDEGRKSNTCLQVIDENLWATQQSDWFDKPEWITMKQDISNAVSDENVKILETFNIAWVLKQVKRNINFCAKKIPFLCVVLVSITNDEADSHNAVFQDLSGKIGGSIHHKLIEKYNETLRPGCILVLRQFSIFSPSAKKHYLCITENNVVYIYATYDEEVKLVKVKHLSWAELAKEADMAMKDAANDKEMSVNKPKMGDCTPNRNNNVHNSSPRVQQTSDKHCLVRGDSNSLSSVQQMNVVERVKQLSAYVQPQTSSQSDLIERFQPSSSKKFTFKRITQDDNVTPVKLDAKPSITTRSTLTMDLCTDFDEEMWKDDDFENLVKDINI